MQNNDVRVCCVAGMPLQLLDLTNYINISDTGMEFIGQITR